MKKLLLLSILLLNGCATVGGQSTTWDEFIKRARDLAVQACGFEPTIATVANIFAAGQFTTAFAIADQICRAVTAAPIVSPGARVAARSAPRVSGVVVRGSFIRR